MYNFNIDLAVECVKSVTFNTQCVTCDTLIGSCVRFPCGHSVCEVCAQKTGECLFCISSPASYVIDKPQTVRLNNAAALLTAFQDTFKIDVHKRQRISDHLKLEKHVFPECIQAPYKYANKRKTSNISFINKENISPKIIPGEEITGSDTIIMKKSVQYVQNWLNQHESMPQNLPRRPFGDININTQPSLHRTRQNAVKLKSAKAQVNAKQSPYKKRSHLKSISKMSSLMDNVEKNNLETKNLQRRLEIRNKEKAFSDSQISHNSDKNESGIVVDDEPLLIEDTDMSNIDKDKQAWLAVLEAAAKDEDSERNELQNERNISNSPLDDLKLPESTSAGNEDKHEKFRPSLSKSVLFYKRASLLETCNLCNNFSKTKVYSSSEADKTNDVSIVINNSAFITTIKFTNCEGSKNTILNKHSVAVQTEKDMPLLKPEVVGFDENTTIQKRKNTINNDNVPTKMLKANNISQSLDIFVTERGSNQNTSDGALKQPKCLIIEDSDSDSIASGENTHEIIAEVHRPNAPESVDCGILRTLSKKEYGHKTKRQIRGNTPNSSNSSDKENFDPNRKKVVKVGKKHKNKK